MLAALRAVADAADQLKMPSLSRARKFFVELYDAFHKMAKREMVQHPAGFEYLPMIAHDDSSIADSDPWNRPRSQTAQWALSHAIFPGEVFEKNEDCCDPTEKQPPAEVDLLSHQVTVPAWVMGICDPAVRRVRSAKCLYLWRCGTGDED
jgi:hypothetical protein